MTEQILTQEEVLYAPGTMGEWIKSQLISMGMFSHHADAIMKMVVEDPSYQSVIQCLDKRKDGYPEILPKIVLRSFRAATLKWIDANIPEHFARPMFSGELDDIKNNPPQWLVDQMSKESS